GEQSTAKMDYIRQNPVAAGLCANADDWRWIIASAGSSAPSLDGQTNIVRGAADPPLHLEHVLPTRLLRHPCRKPKPTGRIPVKAGKMPALPERSSLLHQIWAIQIEIGLRDHFSVRKILLER